MHVNSHDFRATNVSKVGVCASKWDKLEIQSEAWCC